MQCLWVLQVVSSCSAVAAQVAQVSHRCGNGNPATARIVYKAGKMAEAPVGNTVQLIASSTAQASGFASSHASWSVVRQSQPAPQSAHNPSAEHGATAVAAELKLHTARSHHAIGSGHCPCDGSTVSWMLIDLGPMQAAGGTSRFACRHRNFSASASGTNSPSLQTQCPKTG